MPNMWKDGKLVETVDVYRIYKKCPVCGHQYAKHYIYHKKIAESDVYTKMEDATVTYQRVKHYQCRNKNCNHVWEKI